MQPFEVNWSEQQIRVVKEKVARTALPIAPDDAGWGMGTDPGFLRAFQTYWSQEFDFVAAVHRLNKYPQFLTDIDGVQIHFVHVFGESVEARSLLLTHGWPGSHLEFWGVIDRLTQPSRYGGSPDDAFSVVLPSLPGYGFSGRPRVPVGPRAVAAMWRRLMTETLGYESFYAQGGDWGSAVASQLGVHHGDVVRGIHLNMPFLTLRPQEAHSAEESDWGQRFASTQALLGDYARVQMHRPLSIGWATADNPLGQAAWILERFHDWADQRHRSFEEVFSLEDLVTNVSLYVMTENFASALWLYRGYIDEERSAGAEFCATPTGYAAFPGDALFPPPPLSLLSRSYNIAYFSEPERGGHFAAWEVPELFAADLVTWARHIS